MRVICDLSLNQFSFWAGAKSNAEKLTYEEKETISYMLEDIYSEGVDETLINDLFWFDFPLICEWLGYQYDEDNDDIIRKEKEDC